MVAAGYKQSILQQSGAVREYCFFSSLQEHSKQYEDEETEISRYKVWLDNMAFINRHNAEEHGFTVKMNKFGDLTTEEFVQFFNGHKRQKAVNSTAPVFRSSRGFVPMDTVDWRDKGAVTPVKDQKQCGSCWSFAATGSLEGQHFLKTGHLVSLSEQNLIDCSRDYSNDGCEGGRADNAFDYVIANKGIDTETSYPYHARDDLYCLFNKTWVGATMTSYKHLEQGSVTSLTEALTSIGPISVAMDASHKSFQLYDGGVYSDYECSSTRLDHGVLAVGYGTYNGSPYFLVKNSWGDDWGQDGYFMIERSDDNICGLATDAVYPII